MSHGQHSLYSTSRIRRTLHDSSMRVQNWEFYFLDPPRMSRTVTTCGARMPPAAAA